MKKAAQIFREEFAKAARFLAGSYRTLQEIDARTMEILVALLGRTK
jgi:hypothetical protein